MTDADTGSAIGDTLGADSSMTIDESEPPSGLADYLADNLPGGEAEATFLLYTSSWAR